MVGLVALPVYGPTTTRASAPEPPNVVSPCVMLNDTRATALESAIVRDAPVSLSVVTLFNGTVPPAPPLPEMAATHWFPRFEPARSCAQTVGPYAAMIGACVEAAA